MPGFSVLSMSRLQTCDVRLQELFAWVVLSVDCAILCGHRGQEAQHAAFLAGTSKLDWPDGKHNGTPATAVDVVPYPVDWKDKIRMAYFGGYVLAAARSKGIPIRWGHDWNGNNDLFDQKFIDSPHYELIV